MYYDDDDPVKAEPFEPEYLDSPAVAILAENLSGQGACDCDPQVVHTIKLQMQDALDFDKADSALFGDSEYQAMLRSLHVLAKRCAQCMPAQELADFEAVLDKRGIHID